MTPAAGPGPGALVPADPRALADLAVLVARAARADPGGAARLVADGGVLAVWVSPLHGAGLPVVLGLRAVPLAASARVDTTVELAALAERLARTTERLPLPPVQVAGAAWAGLVPPRAGWAVLPAVTAGRVRAAAAEGAAAVAAGVDRGAVWSAPLVGARPGAATADGAGPGPTAGLALAAHALGFLGDDDGAAVTVAALGPWSRLSTPRGHVLARRPLLS